MATYASLLIKIDDDFLIGDYISFNSSVSNFVETAANVRSGANQFTTEATISEQRYSLWAAMYADYNTKFNIVLVSTDSIRITATDYDVSFTDIEYPDNVTATYTANVPETPAYKITGITAQAADVVGDRNTKVRYNFTVENGDTYYAFVDPLYKPDPEAPPYLTGSQLYIDYFRNSIAIQTAILRTYDSSNNFVASAVYTMPCVDQFSISSVVVTETQNGATIACNITLATPPTGATVINTTRQYSLDGIVWKESNIFTSILPGSYTMYVRDNLGASFSEAFEVVGVDAEKPDPVFSIPKANPLRYIKQQDYNCLNVRNWDNCLFYELQQYEAPNIIPKCYNQLITDCDEITTQILTNYDNVAVSVVNESGVVILEPAAEIKKQYISKYDMRDATLFKSVDGYTLLAFSGGNTYDPDTGIANGTYVNPSKKLIEEAVNGSKFTISGTTVSNGAFDPLEQYKDTISGYWTIKLDVVYTSTSAQVTCKCLTFYNEKLYNTVEFTTIGQSLPAGIYTTTITATDSDPRYTDITYISEPLKKIEYTKGTVAIDYNHSYNSQNLDFTTGVLFRLRIEARFFRGKPDEKDDSFLSDDGYKVLQKSIITRSYSLETGLIPLYLVEKLSTISGFDGLLINGISYVKGEDSDSNDFADQMNPLYLAVRSYQLPASVSISQETGIATETQTVIGTSTTIVIGI